MRAIILFCIFAMLAMTAHAHGDEGHDDEPAAAPALAHVAIPDNPTYHEHVRPIIEASCVACHAEGEFASFAPLDEAFVAIAVAEDISWHVVNGYMPPWPPSRDNIPLKDDRSLSDEEIATIAAWAENGAPAGDPTDYRPAATGFAIPEIRPDLVLQLDEAYTPPPDLLDDYRCFAMPLDIAAPQFITGFAFLPDVIEMAHHAIFYLADDRHASAIERKDYADGRPGWSCYGGAGLGRGVEGLGGWAPGTLPVIVPHGTGYLIKPGQQLVLQVHYNLSAARAADSSQIVLQLESAESDLTRLYEYGLTAPVEIPCPHDVDGEQCDRESALRRVDELYGRDSRYFPDWLLRSCGQMLDDYSDNTGEAALGYCDFPITESVTLYSVFGHMHELCSRFRLELNPESDSPLLLLDIPRWDFHWQGYYEFAEPVHAHVGDTLRMSCEWDNSLSDEPRYVVWGEGTSDEMCFGSLVMG